MDIENNKGNFSEIDIQNEMSKNKMFIYPYNKRNITAVGYNLTPSLFILSTKTGIPLKVINKLGETYVWVEGNDTILIGTREYIWVDKSIMGTFYSKVKIVSQGFGHISTTLDPNWKGPLLIALNNPSRQKKKFLLIDNKNNPVQFSTLIFSYLNTKAKYNHDNPEFRIDVLEEYIAKPKSFLFKLILGKSLKKYEEVIKLIRKSGDLKEAMSATNVVLDQNEIILRELQQSCENQIFFSSDFVSKRSLLIEKLWESIYSNEMSNALSSNYQLMLENVYEEVRNKINDGSSDLIELNKTLQYGIKKCKWERIGLLWNHNLEEINDFIIEYSSKPTRLRIFLNSKILKNIGPIIGILACLFILIFPALKSFIDIYESIRLILVSIIAGLIVYIFAEK